MNTKSSRIIPNVSNFRDLGGHRTNNASTTRSRVLYRSNHFVNLTSSDIDSIASLGLKTIVDLRSDQERENAPFHRIGEITKNIKLYPIRTKTSMPLYQLIKSGKATGEKVQRLMLSSYRSYVHDHANEYRELIHLLINEENLPLVFHCSAGKDRTGFGAALILFALGVPYQTVIEDYLLTNKLWESSLSLPENLDSSAREVLLSAQTEYLEASITEIHKVAGSIDNYLEVSLELSYEKRKKLEANLLCSN